MKIHRFTNSVLTLAVAMLGVMGVLPKAVYGLGLDWKGDFRAETHTIFGYSHGQFADGTTSDKGYFVPNAGSSPANFQTLFLRLAPRAVVNDNISLHGDIWFGSPDRGVFGGSAPSGSAQTTYGSSRTGTGTLSVNQMYAQIASDFGTLSIGKKALNWGLGLVWNSGNGLNNRMPSIGDVIQLESKFGAFRVMPMVVKNYAGTNFVGNTLGTPPGLSTNGVSSTISDYALGLSYENLDEQLELGLLFQRRLAGQANGVIVNPLSTSTGNFTGYAYNVWDFYVSKRSGIFHFAAEVPLVSGRVGGADYSTVAAAAEVTAQLNEKWKVMVMGGRAPGQEGGTTGGTPNKLTSFYFHPDYRLGLLMFNYSTANFSSTSASPFDNPVTNAQYVVLAGTYTSGKWTQDLKAIWATATETAGNSGTYFNAWARQMRNVNAGATAQGESLGTELDYTLGYQWDDALRLTWTTSVFAPGDFYKFSNGATPNATKTHLGTSLGLQVKF